MRTRIHEVPAYHVETIAVAAARYNLIHLALRRLGAPLRLELTGLKGLDMLLDTDLWVCVDRTSLDLPILAWTVFDDHQRSDLQAPVTCQLRHYHARTEVLLPRLWQTLERILNERLHADHDRPATVTSLDEWGKR